MAEKIRTRMELEQKIKEIFEIDTISLLISKQITTYVTECGYTYLEIARALFYFFEVQGGDITKCKGIGIVPYVIDDSRRYFKELEQKIIEQKKQAQEKKKEEQNIIVCKIPTKKKVRRRTIDIQTIKEADNE